MSRKILNLVCCWKRLRRRLRIGYPVIRDKKMPTFVKALCLVSEEGPNIPCLRTRNPRVVTTRAKYFFDLLCTGKQVRHCAQNSASIFGVNRSNNNFIFDFSLDF